MNPKYEMLYDNAVTKLAAYYKQDINIGDDLHPLFDEVLKWFKRNLEPKDVEPFYKRILDHCEFFPRLKDLSALYNNFITQKDIRQTESKVERIGYDENMTEESLAKNFIGKEKNEFGHSVDVSLDELLEWDFKLTESEMLKKFGYKLCAKVWHHIGEQESCGHYPERLKRAFAGHVENENTFKDEPKFFETQRAFAL